MADGQMQKIRAQRGKLTLGDLGNPGMVKTMTPEQKAQFKGRYFIGTIVGQVTDFVERKNLKTDEMMEGLRGTFVGMPSDPNLPQLESGILYIPDAFHNILAATLRKAHEKDPSAAVEFAMEVYSIEAKNPAGYSWEMMPLIAYKDAHPLENLINEVSKLPNAKMKLLTAPAAKK